MAGFAEQRDALAAAGVQVIAASVDALDKAQEMAAGLNFPVAWGVSRDVANAIGAWWETDRQFIQPSEFVVGPDGRVVQSSYSSGPLGRIEPEDVLKLVNFLKSKK